MKLNGWRLTALLVLGAGAQAATFKVALLDHANLPYWQKVLSNLRSCDTHNSYELDGIYPAARFGLVLRNRTVDIFMPYAQIVGAPASKTAQAYVASRTYLYEDQFSLFYRADRVPPPLREDAAVEAIQGVGDLLHLPVRTALNADSALRKLAAARIDGFIGTSVITKKLAANIIPGISLASKPLATVRFNIGIVEKETNRDLNDILSGCVENQLKAHPELRSSPAQLR